MTDRRPLGLPLPRPTAPEPDTAEHAPRLLPVERAPQLDTEAEAEPDTEAPRARRRLGKGYLAYRT
ncbi:hypothetical protein [Kitasatospora griseola]|uniref:hypothetical protein n=1 Tax=Kitasatospora griseola TaxID=2064 RepID=UPI00166F7985|nr:hypothetical protein [Kitasatospora griseola]GGR00671.1 hypothetical protein GCM10010195_65590 [Kitasatospora griseola]